LGWKAVLGNELHPLGAHLLLLPAAISDLDKRTNKGEGLSGNE
jgi:hypothetical protein